MKNASLDSLHDENILKLHLVLNQTEEWLPRAGKTTIRKFFFGLLKRLDDENVIKKLIVLLASSSQKDFIYTRSRCNPGLPSDITTLSSNRALSDEITSKYISEVWEWFPLTTKHCKVYYLLHILKLCGDSGLSHQARNFCNVWLAQRPTQNSSSLDFDVESIQSSNYSFHTDDHPELYDLASINPEYRKLSNSKDVSHECNSPDNDCCDVTNAIDMNTMDNNSSFVSMDPRSLVLITSNAALSGISKYIDFISLLPIHLSKSILSKFSARDLLSCALTCKRWRLLVNQVKSDEYSLQTIKEEAILMQGISAKGCNPNYARVRHVLVPLIDSESNDLIEAYKVPHDDYFASARDPERSFESVLRAYETTRVKLEERNIYCGAYNLLVLDKRANASRIIAYAGESNLMVGSTDKLVRTIDIASGRDLKPTMHGHPGTITALFMGTQEEGIVFSGSYDTTIRKWNMSSGSCQLIMHGHRGSITCLDYSNVMLVSGAVDGHLKIWNSMKGSCVCTFKHSRKSPITCVKILDDIIASGCCKGLIKIWSIKTRKVVKVLKNHGGKRINCIYFDEQFLVSGGNDGFLLLWNMPGINSICLKAYRHPKPVTCVKLMFLCAITGCGDGKIRVINMLTSECLRVLRGNSQCDPILHLLASNNKLVINTASNCLVMHFEPVDADYTVQSSLTSTSEEVLRKRSARPSSSMHSVSRANKLNLTKSSDKRILRTTSAPLVRATSAVNHRTKSIRSAPLISNYAQSRPPSNYIDLQPEFIRPRSSYTMLSATSHSSGSAGHFTPQSCSSKISLHSGLSYLSVPHDTLTQIHKSESRLSSAVSSRGPHHPRTRDNILVKVGMVQNMAKHDKLSTATELNAISSFDRLPQQHLVKSIWKDDLLDNCVAKNNDKHFIGKFTTTEDPICEVKMVYNADKLQQRRKFSKLKPKVKPIDLNDPLRENFQFVPKEKFSTEIMKFNKGSPIKVDLFMQRQLGL